MIDVFVASACVRNERIADSVAELAEAGYRRIELTGGTDHYDGYLDDLIELADRYELEYQVHNYFPPPPVPFVLNLASCDDEIYDRSRQHVHTAVDVARRLGTSRYGVHAGFLLDIKVSEAGRRIGRREVNDRGRALDRFAAAFDELTGAHPDIEFYVENNVCSAANHESLGENAFLLTDHDGYLELSDACPGMQLLLDLAHLKVSCHTLGLDFADQAARLLPCTDYIHVSDNDGTADTNHGLTEVGNDVLDVLRDELDGQTVTCEIYSGLDSVADSVRALESLTGPRPEEAR